MDGIIIINKPKNYTSHDIVYKVKKIFNNKVGHTGTLDPMATGVLPILIGKCTQCSKYLINHDKIYKVQLQLGEKRDTADSEGNIIEKKDISNLNLEKEKVEEKLNDFVGKQSQVPPIYSAIKIKGKKLYEYARKGEKVEIKPRDIEIYSIELLNIDNERKRIDFQVSCSKGTYIRSLCEDIAKKIGTIGYMSKLERIQVGDFNINDSITLEELEENIRNDKFINNNIITLENIFEKNKKITLDNRTLNLLLNGVKLTYKEKDGIYKIYNNHNFIGIGTIENNILKRDIIL